MAKDRKKLVHIHSNITDKQPRPEALEVGEIAVNNGISGNTDRSFLSIKNANNEVVRFSSDEQMISWTEKKEVIPFEGQVRGENGPESTKDSGDYGSYGITNDDLLNNKSNLVIKFNQVAASNTPKSKIINGGKDIYGKLVNGTPDASREGAGIAIDMSRYAMRGANPSFSSLTITNGTTLEGGLNVSGNTKIGNGLNVTGATNINGATKITGDTTFNGNETVNGNLTVTGDTNISGNTTIKGDTNISGNTTIDKNLTVNGDTKLHKLSATTANVTNLYATSNISGSSLTATTISGTNTNITNLTANTISSGTLNVNGNTTLNKVTANTINASSISAVSISASNIYTKTDIDNIEDGQNSKIDEISGKTDNVITDVQTLSGEVQTVSGEVHTLSGEVHTLSGEVQTLSGKVQTVSGEVQTVSGEVHTLSGKVQTVSGEVQTLSGEVQTLSGEVQTLSGKSVTSSEVQTMINVAVSGYPNEAEYNSTDKKIYFKHNNTILPSMTIDATDFIKDGMIESVEVVQSGGTSYLKIVWNLDGSSGSTKKTIHLNIGDLFEADNYYTTGQTSGATQIANALAAKQNSLVSGVNIKTINNESILGEGNITIEGGGSSYTAGDGIDITNDVISVTGKVDTSAFTAHTADTVIHVTSDEKAAWNGKQDQLISGVNIKTINNKSILGEGNITIEGGKAIEAGRGISVTTSETADTVSFNLPISAGTVTNALIYNSTTNAASGDFSHAEGYYATASGEGSHAEGQGTTASGTCAHAEGNYSNASGNYSHAEGNSTITNNQSEHASGQFNVSSSVSTTFGNAGNTLFSVGNGTSSNNRKNAFEIRQNGDIYITSGGTDIKLQNHLGGGGGGTSYEAGRAIDITNNLISLDLPISAGTRTNALIYNNTTNVASGYYSNAEGFGTTANGMCSHAEGENTTASGNFSHAEGESTIAKNMSEHASGQYNVSSSASTTFGDAGNTLFSVGNGISDSNRKNAFEIRQNGDTYLNGKLNITGDVTANAFYATSDERLKENIENVSYAKMANAANVNIKSFNFKSDEEKKTVIGVIAQDVENENLGFIVSTSNDGMKAVDYTGLSLLKIAYLEQKIKELENIINELKENKQ